MFFSTIENDHSSFSNKQQEHQYKNHSNGIYEEIWHLCDLRKESFAYGAVGKPILRKTDHFSHYFGKQNHFIKLI